MVERIVIVLFDGLRPDLVTEDAMPNLWRLRRRGTWFAEARSVFPSLTRVALGSIATGAMPARHGVIGNSFYHPRAFAERPLDFGDLKDIARIPAIGEAPVTAPTFADCLAKNGVRMGVVHGGTAGSCFCTNPNAAANGQWVYSVQGRDATTTPAAFDEVFDRFGAAPRHEIPLFDVVTHTADVFVDHVLARLRPEVAFVMFPEPDTSYHYRGISAAETKAVARHADAAFGRILDAIDATQEAGETAIIVASDHGHITVTDEVPLFDLLSDAGFAVGSALREGLAVMGVEGRAGELRMLAREPGLRASLAAWLQAQPFTGMLFTADRNGVEGEVPGTLSLKLVGLDHPRAPDIAFVMRCGPEADPAGLPGRGLMFRGDVPLGCGMHGGLNRRELNATLLVAGPGIGVGRTVDTPVGITDIAPTVLSLLGISAPETMTGRSLARFSAETTVESFETGSGGFAQRLTVARSGRASHLLEGLRTSA
jgi:arylsulfatase A-like enzyme